MKRVVIIGASSGIGEALAKHYASNGCKVMAAARREDRLKALAAEFPENIKYRTMDVTHPEASSAFTGMINELGGADLVVYCSGAGKYSENLNKELEERTIAVNTLGFMNIVIPAFNYFMENVGNRPEHKAQIVTVSSVASIRGIGTSASYSASKRFQTTYFEALNQLANKHNANITLTAILPGFIDTDFINRKYPFTMSLDYAMKHIIKAIEKRKRVAVIDWKWRIIVPIMKLIPPFVWRKIKI